MHARRKRRRAPSDLDGLNIWYEARLLEEGVEDMQNLATANLVDVMLRTRVPVERLVDWVDQAHLYLRVGKERPKDTQGNELPSDREVLRRLGIRTATDLEDAFRPSFRPGPGGRREPDPIEEPADFVKRLRGALDRPGRPRRSRRGDRALGSGSLPRFRGRRAGGTRPPRDQREVAPLPRWIRRACVSPPSPTRRPSRL